MATRTATRTSTRTNTRTSTRTRKAEAQAAAQQEEILATAEMLAEKSAASEGQAREDRKAEIQAVNLAIVPQQHVPDTEPEEIAGVVVLSTPQSRATEFKRYMSESDDSQVSAARILSEIWFEKDWETADMPMDMYMIGLGVGDDNSDHVLSRKARKELVTLLRSADADMPTTREYAQLTGCSQSSAARDLNPALNSNASRTPELPQGDDSGDEKPAEKKEETPRYKTLKVALSDAERATLILRAAGIEVEL